MDVEFGECIQVQVSSNFRTKTPFLQLSQPSGTHTHTHTYTHVHTHTHTYTHTHTHIHTYTHTYTHVHTHTHTHTHTHIHTLDEPRKEGKRSVMREPTNGLA